MRKKIIIPSTKLVEFLDQETLNVEGMEEWDTKQLLELIIIYLGKENPKSIQWVTKAVIDRIGINVFLALKDSVKAIKLMYSIVEKFNYELELLNLKGKDLCFEDWLNSDMILSFSVKPI